MMLVLKHSRVDKIRKVDVGRILRWPRKQVPRQSQRLTPLFFSHLLMLLFALEVKLMDWRQGPEHTC